MNPQALRAFLVCTAASTALLSACGGDIRNTPPPAAISVMATPTPESSPGPTPGTAPGPTLDSAPQLRLTVSAAKRLDFAWADVAGETGYRLLESADGGSDYALLATLPAGATAYTHEVFLPARLNARYRLQACQAQRCLDSAPISVAGQLTPGIGFLKASAPANNDGLGFSVALSDDGRTLAVGAPEEDSNRGGAASVEPAGAGVAENSGAVYVFTREAQAWVQQAFIKALAPAPGDEFGHSLALSADGDTLAVGAPFEGSSGAVFVWQRQGSAWRLGQRVQAADTRTSSIFGSALALSASGQVLAVGDPGEDSQGSNSGAAYVFRHDGQFWTQQAMLKSSAPQAGDAFGISLALDAEGGTLAVGARDDSSSTLFGGAVYVFTGTGAAWSMPLRLSSPQPLDAQSLGSSVALSRDGSTLAAWASGDASPATGVNGNALGTGAPNSGAVHVFAREGAAAWRHQAYLKASNTDQDDSFGRGLALSRTGDTLVVGAPYERSLSKGLEGDQADNGGGDVGAAYVFQRQSLGWRQQAYLKAPNSGNGDQFGRALALSADAQTLVIGAPGESSSTGGWNPVQNNASALSGAVYLY